MNKLKYEMYYKDIVPSWKNSKGKDKFNWNESIGYNISFIYGNIEGCVKIIKYENRYLWIKYLEKEPFKILTDNFVKCKLGKYLGIKTDEFKIEIGDNLKDEKRDLTIVDRKYIMNEKTGQNCKWYKYKCNICGFCDDRSWTIESHLLSRKDGCSCCAGVIFIEGINDVPTTAPEIVKFFQGGYDEAKLYTKGSHEKIYPVCPDCGRIKDKAIMICGIYLNHSIGCICSDGKSYNEKLMFNILEQLKIDFEIEFTPDWCKYEYKNRTCQGRYDFLLGYKNEKYIVETDGGWHTNDNKRSGKTAKDSKIIDDEKDKLAKEHGIKVIRIDCKKSDSEYIKDKIIYSELNDMVDLSVVNWLKCEEFALSNLTKKACEIKRDNPDMTAIDISKIMKLSHSTICNYLKRGSEIWDWINYNGKEEQSKNCTKVGKSLGIALEMFKDGISLGIFESASELARQSESLFGIKLGQVGISAVCNNKRKKHNGYIFKYININQEYI